MKDPVSDTAVVEPGCVKIGTRLEDGGWQKSWWSWLCSLYNRQTDGTMQSYITITGYYVSKPRYLYWMLQTQAKGCTHLYIP
jgi:hypothetical protein